MKSLVVWILLLLSYLSFGQNLKDTNRYAYFKEIISFLANDSLQGRAASTIYEAKTADFIFSKWKKLKRFQPQFQFFAYTRKDSTSVKKSKNVYCYIDNKASRTILIGAHYDHLGFGEGISRSYSKKGIHNGADDNASGVALLLSLAKNFKNWQSKKYNYLFVSYSAHEIGLFGSEAFSKLAQEKFKPIALAINFDMVGRLDADRKVFNVYGRNTLTSAQDQIFDKVLFDGNLMPNYSDKIYQCDLKWFAEKGISCLSFTTGIHSDYHTINDDEQWINYEGMTIIEEYLERLLTQFSTE